MRVAIELNAAGLAGEAAAVLKAAGDDITAPNAAQSPDAANLLIQIGVAQAQCGDFAGAAETAGKITPVPGVVRGPDGVWVEIGLARLERRETAAAEASFEKAAELMRDAAALAPSPAPATARGARSRDGAPAPATSKGRCGRWGGRCRPARERPRRDRRRGPGQSR